MPPKSDKNVGILIELLVDAEQFVTEVQRSLKTGKNLVQKSADEMKAALDRVFRASGVDQNLTRSFQQLTDMLKRSTKSFDAVAKSGKDLSNGLLEVKNKATEVAAAWQMIDAARNKSKQSYQEQAARLVATGKIEASVAQQALAANNQNLIGIDRLKTAYNTLAGMARTAGNEIAQALNITPETQKAITELGKVQAMLQQNQAQLAALTRGKGYFKNVEALGQDEGAGRKIKATATAFGVEPQQAALDLIRQQKLTVNEALAGLNALSKGVQTAVPPIKQLEKALMAESLALEKATKGVAAKVNADLRAAEVAKTNAVIRQKELKAQMDSWVAEAKQAAETQKAIVAKRKMVQAIQDEQKALQQGTKGSVSAYDIVRRKLEENNKTVNILKNSVLGWAEASKRAANDASISFAKAGATINDIAARMGVGLNKAAQIAVATSQATLGEAQAYLSSQNEKLILSEQQSAAALQVQSQQLNKNTASVMTNADAKKALELQEKKMSGAPDPTKNVKSGFAQLADGIVKTVGQLLLFQYVLGQVGTFLEEVNKKAVDFQRTQFQLQAIVGAGRAQMGKAAGTMQDWLKVIKELRKEFPQFSEKDITAATASVAKLAPVLGLNRDQMANVVKQAATLSQVTGEELSASVDDVVRALGGSSVVLDKYGIFIRDADKNTTQFAKSLGKTTDQMTSQELALATLEAIMTQVVPLTENLGNYNDTTAGQIAQANARIEDSLVKIGGSTVELDLLFKNLQATVLEMVANVVPQLQDMLDVIVGINNALGIQNKITAEVGRFDISKYKGEQQNALQRIENSTANARLFGAAPQALGAAKGVFDIFAQAEIERQFQVGEVLRDADLESLKKYAANKEEVSYRIGQIQTELVGAMLSGNKDLEKSLQDELTALQNGQGAFLELEQKAKDYINLFEYDSEEEKAAALEQFKKDYIKYLEERDKIAEELNRHGRENRLEQKRYAEPEAPPGEAPLDPKIQEKLDDYYQKIIDLVIDKRRQLRDAQKQFDQDAYDLGIERDRDISGVDTDTIRQSAEDQRKADDDRLTALIRYQRGLRDLEEKENEERARKQKDFQDKSEEAWRDYYRALERLNQAYLFDLRDAVADNDAVAIKRLERKYNLDKLKIDQQLQDRLEDEKKAQDDAIDQLRQETEDRKAELKQRYEDELEDIIRAQEIQNRELLIKANEQKEDINKVHKEKLDDLNTNLRLEQEAIEQSYSDRLEDIGRELARERDLEKEHYKKLFNQAKEYLGPDGKYLELINGFYDEQLRVLNNRENDTSIYSPAFKKWLKLHYGIDIPDNWTASSAPITGGGGGGGGGGRGTPDLPLGATSFNTPVEVINPGDNVIEVQFSSDGTIPEEFYDVISTRTIQEITKTINGLVVRAV